jgi:uncharacterized protein YbbC (DUF1343 family)
VRSLRTYALVLSIATAALAAFLAIPPAPARGEGARVKTGLDVLEGLGFSPLAGKRVGLLVNQTARTSEGDFLPDLVLRRRDVTLVTIFTPEHGLEGKKDEAIPSGSYQGVPVVSLYGERRKPTVEELKALDVLVYDIQDVGARYYTYLATLAMTLEVAKEAGTKVLVLDRPDPAGGEILEGPIAEAALCKKFTCWSPLPTRYGLTIGEFARWANEVEGIGARLEVVKVEGWRRNQLWSETGLPWRDPSPHLRSADAALLYTGLGILERTNLSVGRGTDSPFLVYGAPFVDGPAWVHALEERHLDGLSFEAADFTPNSSTHAGKLCHGVRVRVTDARKVETVTAALHMIDALRALSRDFQFEGASGMLGEHGALGELAKGKKIQELLERFEAGRRDYERQRKRILLYAQSPSPPPRASRSFA